MKRLSGWGDRPLPDVLLLIAVGVCLAIAVARFAIMLTALPGAVTAHAEALEVAGGASLPATDTVYDRLTRTPQWTSWWGGRISPFPEGGDYIGVTWHTNPVRTVGPVAAVTIERMRARGTRVDRLLVPFDETTFLGQPVGSVFTRPDGTKFLSKWRTIDLYAHTSTSVPVERSVYDPILSSKRYRALESLTSFELEAKDFYVASPAQGGSGTWALFARPAPSGRQFFLIPLETVQATAGASL